LDKLDLTKIELIIIDGYVYLDDLGKPGLGARLYEKLGNRIPVVGVAKTSFADNLKNVREVLRGESAKPLFVSAIGIDLDEAAQHIKHMHGSYRIPALLKRLDLITKK
jgi:deoxyinosine 3'endonuclease (endonuclease V)